MRCVSCQCENPPGVDRCQGCGAHLPEVGDDLESRVFSLMAQGQKIGAIKLYRETTGLGLKEAKEAVEAIERGARPPSAEVEPGDLDDEVASLVQQGRKIEAIRVYRKRTGVGLKEAKDAVEDLAARRGIVAQGGTGCLGAVLIVAALLALTAW
jgi:large subunit ribosomal protein L7/L12